MPQFDPSTFTPQWVWMAITFVILYLLMARVALPRISEVLEEREHKINESLRKADLFRRDAEAASVAYEKMMTEARASAHEAVQAVREEAAREAAERHSELSLRLTDQVAASERRILEARDAAMAGVEDMAVDISATAVARLVGGRIDRKKVAAAVGETMQEIKR